jgi:hypothetical protein
MHHKENKVKQKNQMKVVKINKEKVMKIVKKVKVLKIDKLVKVVMNIIILIQINPQKQVPLLILMLQHHQREDSVGYGYQS